MKLLFNRFLEWLYNWITGNAIKKAWPEAIKIYAERAQARHHTLTPSPLGEGILMFTPAAGWEQLEPEFSENMWQCSNCEKLNDTSGPRFLRTCHGCGKSWQEVASFVPDSPMWQEKRRMIKDATVGAIYTYSIDPGAAQTYSFEPDVPHQFNPLTDARLAGWN